MATSIEINPPALNLSRNQIPVVVLASDYITTAGSYARTFSYYTAPDTDGDTLTLAWSSAGTDYSIVFKFKDAPNEDLFEILTYDGGSFLEYLEWVETVMIPGLLAHPFVNTFFGIAVFNSDTEAGIDVRCRFKEDISLVITPVGFTANGEFVTAGAAEVRSENFTVAARVYVQLHADDTEVSYERLPEINFHPNESEKVLVDLQPYINEYFKESEKPTLPAVKKYTRCVYLNRYIYAEFSQKFGDPVAQGPIKRMAPVKVLQGGVSTHDWPDLRSDLADYLKGDDDQTLRFLTNRTKRYNYNTEDWLFFYVPYDDAVNMRLWVQCFFYGSPGFTGFEEIPEFEKLKQGDTYYIPIGPRTLSTLVPNNCIQYKVWIAPAAGGWASEKITVNIKSPRTGLTVFEYQNALGATETMGLVWNKQRVGAVQQQYFERTLGVGYNKEDAQRIGFDQMLMQTFTLTSTQAQAPDREALTELFMSPEVHLLVDNERIPCTISAGNFNMERQNEGGVFFPNQKMTVNLDRQLSFSRIINLNSLCTE